MTDPPLPPEAMILLDHALQIFEVKIERLYVSNVRMTAGRIGFGDGVPRTMPTWCIHFMNGWSESSFLEWHDDRWRVMCNRYDECICLYEGPSLIE